MVTTLAAMLVAFVIAKIKRRQVSAHHSWSAFMLLSAQTAVAFGDVCCVMFVAVHQQMQKSRLIEVGRNSGETSGTDNGGGVGKFSVAHALVARASYRRCLTRLAQRWASRRWSCLSCPPSCANR